MKAHLVRSHASCAVCSSWNSPKYLRLKKMLNKEIHDDKVWPDRKHMKAKLCGINCRTTLTAGFPSCAVYRRVGKSSASCDFGKSGENSPLKLPPNKQG